MKKYYKSPWYFICLFSVRKGFVNFLYSAVLYHLLSKGLSFGVVSYVEKLKMINIKKQLINNDD